MTDITVPQLGESVTEATVGTWSVKAGDTVKKDDVLVELETDKVAVEVRAENDGVVGTILVEEGETVEIGARLATMSAGGEAAAAAESAPAEPAAQEEATPAPASGGGQTIEATVPQMGESVTEGTIGAWLVKVGDSVTVDQALVEIETDKVAVEVPSPAAGVIAELMVGEGDSVAPGDVVAKITEGAAASAAPATSAPAAAAASAGGSDAVAMPSAARIIEENKLDAGAIEGSGRDGRITKGDALQAAAAPAAGPARGTRAHDAPAPDHRQTPQGCPERGRHPDDL